MEDVTEDFDVVDLYYLTSRSIDDALEESVTGEIFLFITTCKRMAKSYKSDLTKRLRLGCSRIFFADTIAKTSE